MTTATTKGGGSGEPLATRDSVPLQHYISLFRQHLRMLVVLVLLGAVGGAVVAAAKPASYTATVAVLVPRFSLRPVELPGREEVGTSAARAREVTLDTEAQLIWSAEVVDRLASTPGFPADREDLRRRISIIVPPNTRIFTIGVRAESDTAARSGADGVAQAYIALRNRIVGDAVRRDRTVLERRVAILQRQLDVIQASAAQPGDRFVPIRQRTVLRQLNATQARLTDLEGRGQQDSEIVRGAQPGVADSRAADVLVASGLGIGLLCGLLVAARRNATPRRIRRQADIRAQTTVPVLFESDGVSGARDLPRRLRTIAARAGARSIFVAGVPSDLALVAVRLAEVCAEVDGDTVLVDLREPTAPALELAAPPATLRTWRIDSSDFRWRLLPTLARVRAEKGMVVVFGAPLDSADALLAASASDLTLVVVEAGRALDRELTSGLEMLRRAGVPVRGLVTVRPGVDRNTAGPSAEQMYSVGPSQAGFCGQEDSEPRDRTASTAVGRGAMAVAQGGGRNSRVS